MLAQTIALSHLLRVLNFVLLRDQVRRTPLNFPLRICSCFPGQPTHLMSSCSMNLNIAAMAQQRRHHEGRLPKRWCLLLGKLACSILQRFRMWGPTALASWLWTIDYFSSKLLVDSAGFVIWKHWTLSHLDSGRGDALWGDTLLSGLPHPPDWSRICLLRRWACPWQVRTLPPFFGKICHFLVKKRLYFSMCLVDY